MCLIKSWTPYFLETYTQHPLGMRIGGIQSRSLRCCIRKCVTSAGNRNPARKIVKEGQYSLNPLKPSGHYIYHLLCILPTQCVCVFRMVLTINSDCFPKQH
jgi:hypothetical protein